MKAIYGSLMILFIAVMPALAQGQQSANDIVLKMQHDLNLSEDQVTNITQIVDRYTAASNDLQKSVEDGTINQSAVDSQKQQLKAAEEQGLSQYLRSDQLSEWSNIEGQQKGTDTGDSDADSDKYSNLPVHSQ